MTVKHSRGEMASDVADRAPILSHARYLFLLDKNENEATNWGEMRKFVTVRTVRDDL